MDFYNWAFSALRAADRSPNPAGPADVVGRYHTAATPLRVQPNELVLPVLPSWLKLVHTVHTDSDQGGAEVVG